MGDESCKTLPIVPMACLVNLALGIPLWIVFSYVAAGSTRDVLATAQVDEALTLTVLKAISLSRAIVLALTLAALVIVMVHVATHAMDEYDDNNSNRESGACTPALKASCLTATACLLWVVLLSVVALLALTAAWFLGSQAANVLLNTATSLNGEADKTASLAVDSAQTLIEQLKTAQLGILDAAPRMVKGTPWFKGYRQGIKAFNQTVLIAAGTPSSADCRPSCIFLDFFAGLAGLNSTCICVLDTIELAQQQVQSIQQATMYSLLGLVVVYLGTSWLLMYFTASSASSLKKLKKMAGPSATTTRGEASI